MATNEVFAERLKQRMEEKGLKPEDLVGVVGIGPVETKKLLAGDLVRISGYMIYEVAKFLECNDDWLLGKTDDPETQKPAKKDPHTFYRELRGWLTSTTRTDCPTCMVGWLGFQHFSHAMKQEIETMQPQDFRALVGWLRHRGVPAPKVIGLEARRRLRAVQPPLTYVAPRHIIEP